MAFTSPYSPSQLLPGDCLLYRPSGVFGWIIKAKTWHAISHVEVWDGHGQSWASRDGLGVNLYPNRLADIDTVMRPRMPVDLDTARRWAASMIGTPYGWGDLLEFVNVTHDFKGIVCSPFATEWYRAGGLDPFNGEDSAKIAPFEFTVTAAFSRVQPLPPSH